MISRSHVLSKKGFTLIEVVLAISILSTLSILVATATTRALKSKKKIQAEVSDVSSLRDTMKVIRSDIYQTYNHVDFEKEITDKVTKPATGGALAAGQNVNQQNPAQPARENKREDPRTEFLGTENKINFITLNNGRMTANDIQADFVEVGYEVKGCKNLSTPDKNSQCLFRRIQKILDKDIEKGGQETVILENVSEFTLRYLVEGKEDWVKEWKSVLPAQNSTATKNIFPDAVEVTLAIEREFESKKKKYSLQYVIPLHFANNLKLPSTGQGSNTPSTPQNPAAPPPQGGSL